MTSASTACGEGRRPSSLNPNTTSLRRDSRNATRLPTATAIPADADLPLVPHEQHSCDGTGHQRVQDEAASEVGIRERPVPEEVQLEVHQPTDEQRDGAGEASDSSGTHVGASVRWTTIRSFVDPTGWHANKVAEKPGFWFTTRVWYGLTISVDSTT